MTVAVAAGRRRSSTTGETVHFCCEGCRDAFARQHAVPTDPFTCGLVLGAGGSKRLGRPKQLLPYRDGTLLGHVVGTARACRVRPDDRGDRRRRRRRPRGRRPERRGGGRQRRLRRGLLVLDRRGARGVDPRCDVLVLMLGDQPGVTAETVAALLAGRGDAELAVCRYDDGRGHPIAFARSVFGDARGPARRQGRVAAARPRRRRRRRGARGGADPARRRHARGLRGGPGRGRGMNELARIAPDVETLAQRLAAVDYLVDEGLATSLFLGLRLPQPLLLEGEAGVGKTEAARALAAVLDTPLIRLQCYDGIDAAEALYEWNYPRQLLSIRLAEAGGTALREEDLFSLRVPDPAAAAAGARAPRPAARGAADRRDRPRRRRLRGVPARAARRGARDDPRARHDRAPRTRPRSC